MLVDIFLRRQIQCQYRGPPSVSQQSWEMPPTALETDVKKLRQAAVQANRSLAD